MLQNRFLGNNQFYDQSTVHEKNEGKSCKFRIKQGRSGLKDYQLGEAIGEGGFAKVHKAVHRNTAETVAVKIIALDQCNPEQIPFIQKEISFQKNILHQNIAQIYETVRTDNRLYVIMEYCKNGELFQKIRREGPLSQIESVYIFNQILSALLYLKENKISHRDIKPENILFDQNWKVKLIDFGLGCCAQQSQLRRTVCGSPSYVPPEIIKNIKYDPELVDVWQLGVTLYATLSGRLPFQGVNDRQRKNNILNIKFQQLSIFSTKAQNLFSSIFVEAKYRPRLSDLKMSQFSMISKQYNPHFIDFKNQRPVLEEQIIEMLSKEYHFDPNILTNSVCRSNFDRYYAMYYLILKKVRRNRQVGQEANFIKFKKQRKGSLIKLQPIDLCKSVPKKQKEKSSSLFRIKMKKLNDADQIFQMKLRVDVDPKKSRFRKDDPDSPRRLLDCLQAYKNL